MPVPLQIPQQECPSINKKREKNDELKVTSPTWWWLWGAESTMADFKTKIDK